MGVPKFYRWISERYPCLSEVVKEYQIPEYDNLYLDMNGIIHNCSHPNDDDPHFRITEEQIFKDIFHYIEILFRLIQPRKVFFMAIDGVAPRAKMNQQRGRRFRSAKEAEENEKKAREKGEVLPTEARFDSNCITPGTEFMAKLDAQLQYFVTAKMSNDKLWHECKVIYSGHKTPGEGEHKIMEYIRFMKSQPNYDPNTRHCLYGLDADLMMLGLTSHEPHFSLLREEVRFGRKKEKSKRTPTPEETTFHLLHLSLMREYIEYEFYELRETLSFPFDVESVIDDWVLMGFLVGNDFIPHLPGLHINKDALPILYDTYKQVLPSLDGYLNEGGNLNLKRFEKFMAKLTEFDVEQFHEHSDNMKYIRSKKGDVEERAEQLETFAFDDGIDDNQFGSLEDCPLDDAEVSSTLARLGIQQDLDPCGASDSEVNSEEEESQFDSEFRQHKRHYYMSKMGFDEATPKILRGQAAAYVRGLQWILHYYYNGICSWDWFYPFHYAPYISDVKDFADCDVSFEKGRPFLPFEQLLGVLPPLSVKLLPSAFTSLMLSDSSPLIQFYPKNFQTDLNGKQQDWEAVVLIPFINEKKLLEEMKNYTDSLSKEERSRNSHGPMFVYTYTPDILDMYRAPQYFPPVSINHCAVDLIWREEWDMHPSDFIKGLLPGAKLDVYFAGFPTLKHLDHTFRKGKESVKVFQQPSRGDNFILEITEKVHPSWDELLKNYLGKEVLVSWPHLIEAKIIAISSAKERYYLDKDGDTPLHEYLDPHKRTYFDTEAEDFKNSSHGRWGVDIKSTQLMVYAKTMSGRNYIAAHDGKMTLEKYWTELTQPFAFQTIVRDISVHDPGYKQCKSVREYFANGTKVFMLGQPHYGCMGEVMDVDPEHRGRIRISMAVPQEPQLTSTIEMWNKSSELYMSGSQCASRVGMSPHLFARITGTVFLAPPLQLNPFQERETAKNKLNIGLNLKNNKKTEEVIGFTRKCSETNQWLYSEECIIVLREYQEKFPEIFEFLHNNTSKNDIFQDEVFPDNYQEKHQELSKWLKESPFASAERCKWGSVFLDPNVVDRIAEEVEKVSQIRAKIVKMQVKPFLLFKPNPLQGSTPPDPSVTFEMFDRVINVREGFSVPLGTRGTIIGIQPAEKDSDKLYDILCDNEFPGGMTLSGPKSKHRCYRLHWAAMINISHKNGGDRPRPVKRSGPMFKHNFRKEYGNRSSPFNNKHSPSSPQSPKSWNGNFSKSMSNGVNRSPNVKNAVFSPKPMESVPFHPPQPKTIIKQHPEMEKVKPAVLPLMDQVLEAPPPNPSQLPVPFNFRAKIESAHHISEEEKQSSGNEEDAGADLLNVIINQALAKNAAVKPTPQVEKGKRREIRNESEVPFVIHGNFFSNWSTILERGLRKDDRNFIPCVTYVPPKMGIKSYQIHIYLDVKKLLGDGFKLFLCSEGQVLCPTGSNGFLSPYYFEKVIDTENNCVIFPRTQQPHSDFESPKQQPQFGQQMQSQQVEVPPHKGAVGRGKVMQDRAYESIWNQMQRPGAPPQAPPPQENRKEVSLSELFQNAALTTPPRPSPAKDAAVKSPFIPTQVARKQTPRRKTVLQAPPPPSDSGATPPNSVEQPSFSAPQKSPNAAPGSSKKTKKKPKSRIAANFPPKD